MDDSSTLGYYSDHADEYDEIYEIPELQSYLEQFEAYLKDIMSDHKVLEVACGTGHWTNVMANTAEFIAASDAGRDILQVAKSNLDSSNNIELLQSDAYNPPITSTTFSAGFAGGWWSHIPKERIHEFLQTFHSRLSSNAQVCFLDTSIVQHKELHTDNAGNRYENRELNDGSQYTVLKNFPTENQLRETIAEYGSEIEFHDFKHFWCLSYRLNR
jgi:ubiquinone/menaquinone biosynthesis C-methylase UbiE